MAENNKRQKVSRTDTKARILKESEILFAEKGFDNTGIEEIAQKVGITKSVIYYHFKNKDEILKTMFRNLLDNAFAYKEGLMEKVLKNPDEGLKTALKSYANFSEPLERIVKIILMESLKKSKDSPIFKLWDVNMDFVFKKFSENMKPAARRRMENFLFEAFFMIYIPILANIAFADQWCEHFNVSREEAREKMVDSIDRLYKERIRPMIWNF